MALIRAIETAGASRFGLSWAACFSAAKASSVFPARNRAAPSRWRATPFLGSIWSQSTNDCSAPAQSSRPSATEARPANASRRKILTRSASQWPKSARERTRSRFSRASLNRPSPRATAASVRYTSGCWGASAAARSRTRRACGPRSAASSIRARISGAGGHSGCLAARSRIRASASSVRPSRTFCTAGSSSFSAAASGLPVGCDRVSGPANVAGAEFAASNAALKHATHPRPRRVVCIGSFLNMALVLSREIGPVAILSDTRMVSAT